MSIRTKFFALAGFLLVLFALVVLVLALLQASTTHKLRDIVENHAKLQRILADLDTDTSDYELHIERLRRQASVPDKVLEAAQRRIERTGERIRKGFADLETVLGEAVAYDRDSPEDLTILSRVQGALPIVSRQVEPFLATGKSELEAIAAGRSDEAHAAALDFVKYEDAFGPDLGKMRASVTALTEQAAKGIFSDQQLNMYFSFALFAVASVIGIGIAIVGSDRVVAALRRLLASTKAMESGDGGDVTVLVTTHDEVGELARAFNRMVAELRARERIKDTFGKFIDPRIVTRLISDDGSEAAERKTVTIFFSDIKGFSGIGERLTAAAMVNLLNGYFTAVAEEIRRHHGIIDKYIGDGVMAFWCTPFSNGDDHAIDGCRAALAQEAAVAAFRQRLPEVTGLRRDTPDLVVRMGIATGEVVVGTIGSPNARSYTVMGDTVNLASRLEGVNKVYGTTLMIAEDTYRLAQQAIEARELDVVTVAGKTEPIRIYELMAEAGALDGTRAELRSRFAEGLEAYRRREWSAAESCFRACLDLVPGDGPATTFLSRIAQLRSEPPPADWQGVWHLQQK